MLIVDIYQFTSFATRFSAFIGSILVLLIYPFGLGLGTYIYFFPKILEQSFNFAQNIFLNAFGVPLSYREISEIIETGINIGAKSGILQSIMLSGWVGLLFWFLLYKNTMNYISKLNIKGIDKIILELLIIFTFIQLLIGSEYTLLYAIWIPIAFAEIKYITSKKENLT